MAMMLGTALTTLAGSPSSAAEPSTSPLRAVTDLSRYCTTCWRNARLPPDHWADCTQEVFGRLLERLPANVWNRVLQSEGEERREFLRAIDTVKKRTQRSRARFHTSAVDEVADRAEENARRLAEDREAVARVAADVLTPRQRQVLALCAEGWSIQDIATRMDLKPERISDEKYKAVRKLHDVLNSRQSSLAS